MKPNRRGALIGLALAIAAGSAGSQTPAIPVLSADDQRTVATVVSYLQGLTTASGRRYALAIYVNNVAVSLDPDATRLVAGQAMGEIAAAGYATLP